MCGSECICSIKKEPEAARLVIRHLRRTDRACTAELQSDCFPESSEGFKETATHKLVVATQGGIIVGYLRFEIKSDCIQLANVCVARAMRGQDLCQKLVAWLIGKLGVYRRTKIELIAWPKDDAARHCYRKMGFRARGGDETDWHMEYEQPQKREDVLPVG